MNIFICLQAKIYRYPILAAFQRKSFYYNWCLFQNYTHLMTIKGFFNFQTQCYHDKKNKMMPLKKYYIRSDIFVADSIEKPVSSRSFEMSAFHRNTQWKTQPLSRYWRYKVHFLHLELIKIDKISLIEMWIITSGKLWSFQTILKYSLGIFFLLWSHWNDVLIIYVWRFYVEKKEMLVK